MSSPLTINLVLGHQIPFPPVQGGGVNNLVWMLAKQFAALGHTVRAYSPTAPGLPEREIDSYGIQHFRVPGKEQHPNVWINNLQGLPYSARVWPLLKPADVTSFHTTFSFLLRRKAGLGVCTHTLHRTPKWILRFQGVQDRIYGGSHAVVEQAIAIRPDLAPKLKAVHNCIELPEQMPSTTLVEPLTFLYVGRFVPDKGLESLIRGFLAAAPGDAAMRLRIIGPQTGNEGADEAFFAQMKNVVAADPHRDQVSLEPSIFDREVLFAQIARAAVFCLPSLTGETFSMAALEAMSMAKALLVSDFGPMREMVDHGSNGYIAKAGDAAAWTAAVRWFSQNRQQIPTMGRHSFEKARECFSAEKIAREYIDDFRMLMAQR
jgi:glycosyltransferase involved in cell wall biosynthesis